MDEKSLVFIGGGKCKYCAYAFVAKRHEHAPDVSWSFTIGRFWHALRRLLGKRCNNDE